jgi:hypothetical protein
MGLVDPTTLRLSPQMFDCTLTFRESVRDSSGDLPRSEVQVDGVNVYPPHSANNHAGTDQNPAWLPVIVSDSYDPATGNTTVNEQDRLLKCLPDDATCSSFAPAGVELDRVMVTGQGQRDVEVTDTWRSTDGQQHALDALYDETIGGVSPDGASFDFPGTPGFQTYDHGDQLTLPHGPGSILTKWDSAMPDTGDGVNPQGAITYSSAPDGPVVFHKVEPADDPEFTMEYTRTIPAGGQVVLRFGVADAFSLSDVRGFAQATLASFAPSLSIDFPADGAVVHRASLVASGKAGDTAGVSLTVNGQPTSVAGGRWARQIALTPGANTITAVATDPDGFSVQRQVTIIYAPAKLTVSGVKRVKNGVRVRLSCADDECAGGVALSARERLLGRKIVGLGAKRKRHVKTVGVGRKAFALQPGQTRFVTVKLNRKGLKLLKRFRKLPLRVSVTQTQTSATPAVVKTAKLTLRAPAKKHKRRH